MTPDPTKPMPFVIVNAFTTDIFRGNPAAVVFTNPDIGLSDDTMNKIAKNFNQPMTCFVSKCSTIEPDASEAIFHIRWFTGVKESAACGHGTLAAVKAIICTQGMVPASTRTLRFERQFGPDFMAIMGTEGQIEITLPSTDVTESSEDEKRRLTAVYEKAFGKALSVKFMGRGGAGFENYFMIEIEAEDELAECDVKYNVLKATGYPINIVTSASSNPGTTFVSRMFAPAWGIPEDHVCGSAHCLLAPYWSKKKGTGSVKMAVKTVSARGGDLGVMWDEPSTTIRLRGDAVVTARGELYL